MKICILNTAREHGGSAIVAIDIAKGMSQMGHSVFFVCSGDSDTEYFENGYKMIILKQSYKSPFYHYFNPKLLWKLNKKLKKYSPDIIHIHNLNLQTFSLSTLFFSKKYPILWTFHDVWPLCMTGWPESPDCIGILFKCRKCSNWPSWLVRINYFLKEMTYRVNRFNIAFPSLWIQSCTINSVLSKKMSFIINNGIDDKEFINDEPIKIEEKSKTILFCGGKLLAGQSPSRRKGWQDLLSATESIYSKYKNIKILYIGDPIKIPKNINIQINFMRNVKRNDMIKYYKSADIFALPTIADNFPLTILEAMACKIPIIASAVGGIPEIITHKKTGMLCQSQNSASLAKNLIFLLENPKETSKITNNAYSLYRNKYRLIHMVKKYELAYQKTINDHFFPKT